MGLWGSPRERTGDTEQKKYLCSLKQAQVKGAHLHDGQRTSLSPPPNAGLGRVPGSFLSLLPVLLRLSETRLPHA